MKPIHIKWVLAHEPIDIFIRAAEKFAQVVEDRAPGEFEIEVLTLSEYWRTAAYIVAIQKR